MFWISIPSTTKLTLEDHHKPVNDNISDKSPQDAVFVLTPDEQSESYLCVGHVALDRTDFASNKAMKPDASLASRDLHILTIATLFVHPAYSKFRLGAFAMDQCEAMAQQLPYGDPECREVTVNTLSPRYYPGGQAGVEGYGRWEHYGWPAPKMDNSLWYVRRGYVTYKEEVRYLSDAPDGTELKWYGVCMRKKLVLPVAAFP